MCDPVSGNDTKRIEEMTTKEYAFEIYTNITDVRDAVCSPFLISFTRLLRILLIRPNIIIQSMTSSRTMEP